MSGTLKIGGKTLATHDTSSNKLAFHSDANDTGQLCRAWVNFNGTLDENSGGLTAGENVLIRASLNVSSVYYNGGIGDYTVNFTTAMPDANYSAVLSAGRTQATTNAMRVGVIKGPPNASYVRIATCSSDNSPSDVNEACVAIFR